MDNTTYPVYELADYANEWEIASYMDTSTIESRFSDRFKEACEMKGYGEMTQIELGELFGLSGPMINYYMKGKKIPAILTAVKICEVLGVSVNWLLLGKGKSNDGVSLEEVWMSYPEEDRINFLANLANRHRK